MSEPKLPPQPRSSRMHFPLRFARHAFSRRRALSFAPCTGTFPFIAFTPYYMRRVGRSQAFPRPKSSENRPPPIFLRFPLCGCVTLCYNMLNFNDWRTIPMASKTNKKAEQKQKMVRVVAIVACCAERGRNTPLPFFRRRRFFIVKRCFLGHAVERFIPLSESPLRSV